MKNISKNNCYCISKYLKKQEAIAIVFDSQGFHHKNFILYLNLLQYFFV